jgi:hypothetical protein
MPMSAPKRPNDFFEFFTVPQEFQIGFGRKVLPDWVIARRARIRFHLISEGPLVHEWQTRVSPRKCIENREHFMPSCCHTAGTRWNTWEIALHEPAVCLYLLRFA